jgi:hypothetical protein
MSRVEKGGDRQVTEEGKRGKLTINPMLLIKIPTNHTRSKAPRRIQTPPSIENPHHLRNKKRQTNAHRRNKSRLMLLLRQHKNRKHQLGSQYRLNKHTSHSTRPRPQRSPHIERRREKTKHHSRSSNPADDLCEKETNGADDGKSPDEDHAQGDGGVEKPAADTEEDPDVDHEGEAEDDGDVQLDGDVEAGGAAGGGVGGAAVDVGDLGAGEGEEEEHGCTDEFADCGDEVWGWGLVSFRRRQEIGCLEGIKKNG